MREIRKSGSEGGAGQNNVPFLPLSFLLRYKVSFQRDNGIIEPFSVHAFTFFERIIDIHSRFLFILSE